MDLGIAGERALILGGTKGLGLSAAASLAQEGVRVALVGRDSAAGTTAARTLPEAVFLQGDLGDTGFRQSLPAKAAQALGGAISILITNAGGPPTGEFHEMSLDSWRSAFELNLFGHVEIAQALVPDMVARGFGRIVNITSFVAKEPYPNMSLSKYSLPTSRRYWTSFRRNRSGFALAGRRLSQWVFGPTVVPRSDDSCRVVGRGVRASTSITCRTSAMDANERWTPSSSTSRRAHPFPGTG